MVLISLRCSSWSRRAQAARMATFPWCRCCGGTINILTRWGVVFGSVVPCCSEIQLWAWIFFERKAQDILKERIHHIPKFHHPFELSIFIGGGGDFLSTRIILDLKEIYGNIICFRWLFDGLMLRIRSYVHLTLECFHSLPKGLEADDPEQWRVKFVWTDLYKEMLRNNHSYTLMKQWNTLQYLCNPTLNQQYITE